MVVIKKPHIYTNEEGVKITKIDKIEAAAIPGTAAQAYANHYDDHFADRIRERQMRSAKMLFG